MYKHTYITINIILFIAFFGLLYVNPTKSEAKNDFQIDPSSFSVNLSINRDPIDTPIRLKISSANIDTNVVFGKLSNGTWEVDDMYASYAEGSSMLDERLGNTIIYAHARDGLFMNLNKVKIDDRIVVFGSESIYEFIVTETKNIYPDEVNDLISVGDHNLTLFTCDGYGDQYRLLIKAVRVTNNNFNTKEVI